MQDLWRLSAADLAALIKSKKVSAHQAATSALARLDAVNPDINAVVDHKPDDVLKQAASVDAAIARGEDPGVLAGVPITVKVNIDQEGFATTNGLTLQREAIATANSPVIDNFRKAGAVILGRTNCPAFSYRWFTTNLVHGDTKNPRDPSITPGGSSGGAGSAVAAGIGHIAHGTDIAGSIRYPAYACGVHGLRPTPSIPACRNAPSVRKSRRCPGRSRARSRTCGFRWLPWPQGMRAIHGGCLRRSRDPRCQSVRRSASTPMDSTPSRK
jgi:amidase